MAFLSHLLHHPNKLRLRRAIFQAHLWLGIALSVYVAVIGLSGSVLVWGDELQAHALRSVTGHGATATVLPVDAALAGAKGFAANETLTYILFPLPDAPVYAFYFQDAHRHQRIVRVDAATGRVLPQARTFVDWVRDLHVSLLMGQTGFVINCIAGIGLLVLALTGAALWWPGIRLWMRGFRVNLRHGWKRINFDTHNAIGIWTLAIVGMWGATAVYFLAPAATVKAIGYISPLRGMVPPAAPPPQPSGTAVGAGQIVDRSHRLNPQAFLSGMSVPETPDGSYFVDMQLRAPGDFSHRDAYTFARDGRLLTIWHYGRNQTPGDWLVWLVYPLHFGTLWGTTVKVLWCLLGLSLPLLSLTGLGMYWNRYLGKRWRALRSPVAAQIPPDR